jgi:hypothetical protein
VFHIFDPKGIALTAFLSYIPKLRRLSIKLTHNYYQQVTPVSSTVLNYLTHVSLILENLKFDEFEPFIKQYFGQIKVLQISSNSYYTYLDADRWEKLILSHMPYLRIFDIQHTYKISYGHKHETMFQHFFEKFTSSFWSERKWFFAYDYNSEKSFVGLFYSIEPYR